MRIIDITPVLSSETAVWEGDTPFRTEKIRSTEEGDNWNLGTVHMSLHTGAHADAFRHFLPGFPGIDQMPLENYVGPVYVFSRPGNQPIQADELESVLRRSPCRLLLRTNPHRVFTSVPAEFAHFTVEAARLLADSGLRLVGIDSPSVDAATSDSLPVHHILGEAGISLLENLDLANVEDGFYELIALPLKIAGGDASPVRAVLRCD